jgi:cellulose synthase/poly-beta-1,6-N-acetylglucosamine synthase-like glycosyltransferase
MAIDLADGLALSVVVPVRDGAEFLPHCLSALRASDLPPSSWELIVVDDGSRDGSADIAARYADQVVRLPPPAGGPPSARNRGAEVARAPVIVFVDADVCVHRDALRRIRDILAEQQDLSAVFGAYDLSPTAPSLVSQYRNLLHSYVHRRDAGEAVTFWTGLGAVRRDVLTRCGGFDERERLDDVELGYRIAVLGHRIMLNPDIQGTHLKRWTLASVITTDVADRGVPWVRLLIQGRRPPGRATLNVRGLEQLLTALTGIAIVAMGIGLANGDHRWLFGSGLAAAAIIGTDWRLLRWLASLRGWLFAVSAIPLRLLYFALNLVAVVLALLPVSWSRRESRQASVHPDGWVTKAVPRGVEPQSPIADGLDQTGPLVAGPERTQAV